MKNKEKEYEPGSVISVRIPKKAPAEFLDWINELKEKEKKNFGKKMVEILTDVALKDTEITDHVYLPLPDRLTEKQREMFDTPMQKRVLGHIVYQMMTQDSPIHLTSEDDSKEKTFNTSKIHENFADQLFNMDDD